MSEITNGYLCFSRKAGQSFYVGKDVRVEITEISGGQVKIAIKAPRAIEVLRTELVKRDQENGKKLDW